MTTDPSGVVRAFYATIQQAWNDGDGAAFGAAFDTDASFIDIRGAAHDGSAGIAADHQGIFDTVYKGSIVHYDVERARAVSDGVIVATGRARLDAPAGPLAGIHDALNTIVLVRSGDAWRGVAFHNTLVTA